MTAFQTLALLLTFAAIGAYINSKFLKLPSTIGLMAVTLLLSLIAIELKELGALNLTEASTFIAHIDFSGLFLHGLLSFLLFAGALHVDLSELKKFRVLIAILATVSVVVATFVTGGMVWQTVNALGFSFPYIDALLFGALIAPTDPVAVLDILKKTGLSKNLRVKIASESLFNDGVGVVVFLALLEMNAGRLMPNILDITALLIWKGLGSLILGLTLGWLTFKMLATIDDYKVEVLLTLALVAGGYSLAEVINMSAPITMVLAGLYIGNHGVRGMSERTRQNLFMFWDLLDEILNALLFVFVGFEVMVITIDAPYLALGLMAIISMLTGRFISVALPVLIMRSLHFRFERGTIRLLTWGGLRGGISIAMALALPQGPNKELIIAMTYIVVVFSILFQGTTFQHAARLISSSSKSAA